MKQRRFLSESDKIIRKSDIALKEGSLVNIQTVFPFTLFPDKIIVDEKRINIIRMTFFYSYYSQTIPIENIQEVIVESNPFFGSLVISEKWDPGRHLRIRYLKRREAIDAKKIIQELMIEQQNLQSTNLGFQIPR